MSSKSLQISKNLPGRLSLYNIWRPDAESFDTRPQEDYSSYFETKAKDSIKHGSFLDNELTK